MFTQRRPGRKEEPSCLTVNLIESRLSGMSRNWSLTGLSVLILLATLISTKAQTATSPTAVTDSFYKKYIAYQMRGLPSEKQVKSLTPLFAQDIMAMIAADRIEQKKFIKEHPDEKP